MQWKRDNASDLDLIAGLFDALAVDPDMARFDQSLRKGAALHQPDAAEVEVDPHRFSFASSAKA
jgi:hypothetical protein